MASEVVATVAEAVMVDGEAAVATEAAVTEAVVAGKESAAEDWEVVTAADGRE